MTWSLAFPNLLVGLREGLEAGLVVTILVSSTRRLAPEGSLRAIWVGVAGAVVLSFCFGAVLTFTRAELSPRAQEVFGGTLSLITVALVSSMLFWMRRAARGMSGEIRGRVGRALGAGGLALVITAFVSVAREGLEAALFIWTNAQAAGSSTSPLLGALAGMVLATGLCLGLYRRVVSVNLGRFFTVTGAALVVIVSGVLAYGVTDLQDANVLPGVNSLAFDVSRQVPTGRWWSELIRGVTNLNNRMSWLAIGGYLAYLVIALTLFLRPAGTVAVKRHAVDSASGKQDPDGAGRPRRRRNVLVPAALSIPVLVAGAWVALDYRHPATASAHVVTVTDSSCGADWSAPRTGASTYAVRNASTSAVDIELVTAPAGAVAAEIEVLGPGTTRPLPVTMSGNGYRWQCIFAGSATLVSSVQTAGGTSGPAARAVKPATAAELAPAVTRYRGYVASQLAELTTEVRALHSALTAGEPGTARAAWLSALLTYHRVGAAYNAFGADGAAVDGLASGLPRGVADPSFVGLHRIEYGLWHGQRLQELVPLSAALVPAVSTLIRRLPTVTFDPNDVTIRAHEIVEDTIRFVLTGQSDYGCRCGYATAQADLTGDRAAVDAFAPMLSLRESTLVPRIHRAQDTLHVALASAVRAGVAVTAAPHATVTSVDAAAGALAEVLAPVPDLLEVRAR